MIDPKILDDLTRKLSCNLPAGLAAIHEDIKRNLGTAVEGALARLDLVTREEFDVQTQVLARTREKLEALEREVAALELELAERGPGEAGTPSR